MKENSRLQRLNKQRLRNQKELYRLDEPQLRQLKREFLVYLLLFKIFPDGLGFNRIVDHLKKRVSRKTIWNALERFREEGIVTKTERIIPSKGQYKRSIYSLNLDKYSTRPFAKSAKSNTMKYFESYFPNFLYWLAIGQKLASKKNIGAQQKKRWVEAWTKAIIMDEGVNRDVEEMKRHANLLEMGK